MSKKTINETITAVLSEANSSLTAKEILSVILAKRYYDFKSANPINIITNELRRHTAGNKTSTGRKIIFQRNEDGRFELVKN